MASRLDLSNNRPVGKNMCKNTFDYPRSMQGKLWDVTLDQLGKEHQAHSGCRRKQQQVFRSRTQRSYYQNQLLGWKKSVLRLCNKIRVFLFLFHVHSPTMELKLRLLRDPCFRKSN